MKTTFYKYHALGNDFLIVEGARAPQKRAIGKLAKAICDRRTGVGADGILYLSPGKHADVRVDVFNADGGWAEKSGNGLRIVALHLKRRGKSRKDFVIQMGGSRDAVRLIRQTKTGWIIQAEIGRPDFRTKEVPVKSRLRHLVNQPLKIARKKIMATCLSVGNPHCVIGVDDFAFDWKTLGHSIEHAPIFPQRANVEFVQIVNRGKIKVAEWERGAGATGSSGTGAAAAVAAMVMQGLVNRKCEVMFEPGSLMVNWRAEDNIIELQGPVEYVASGTFEHR